MPPIRVLHLFSNSKWTGPAEPALNLCVALRGLGVDARFACAPDAGASVNMVVATARDRGIEPVLSFRLNKHRNPWHNFLDRRALRRWIAAERPGLIHCHLDNDHEIALAPAAAAGVPLVRSSYAGEGFPDTPRHRRLVAGTALLLEPSELARKNDTALFGVPEERIAVVPGAVDTERFDPCRETPDGRRRLNLPPDAFVLGIVARMQTHRHYEDLFEAFARLAAENPGAHLVVVGRGTNQETVGFEPVRRLGLADRVHFTGYIAGEDYVGMLRAFDAGVLLVPGSDGTCRAVREALAMGRPMVVADRGMLAEIVADGQTGLVCDGTPDGLHAAFAALAADRARRAALGRNARAAAEARHALPVQAAQVLSLYETVLRRTATA